MAGTDEPEGFGANAEDLESGTEEGYGSDAGEDLPEDDTGESGFGEDTDESGIGAEEREEYQDRDEDVAEPFDDEEREGGTSGGMDAGQDDESSGM